MKTNILVSLVLFVCFVSNAQITFEKGYFIDNSNQKTVCLIKNLGWKNNPSAFEFKLSESGEIQNGNIGEVVEFGFESNLKYKRFTVSIDRASNLTGKLTREQRLVYKKETLFLKVLLQGDANLYFYEDGNLRRFFYNKSDNDIQPLVYKRYLVSATEAGSNTRFRQQLLSSLTCDKITNSRIENLSYKQEDLEDIFNDYNACINPEYVSDINEKRKTLLNFNVRPGVSFLSMIVENRNPVVGELKAGSALSLRLGGELEVLLPFNKNKWALTVEPFYRGYSSEFDEGQDYKVAVRYQSIVISGGLRYYMFVNPNVKVFVNANFGIDIPLSSSFEFERKEGGVQVQDLESRATILDNYWSFGLGVNINNHWSLESRYEHPQNLLIGYTNWRTEYGGFSVILGYTVF